MCCFIVPVFAFLVLGADQPLVPFAHLDSEAETWPVALTLDGKSLLGVLKSGDHRDVVVWDTTSKSRTFLVKGSMGLPLAVSPDRQNVAGMVLSNIKDGSADAEIVIWDVAKTATRRTAAFGSCRRSGEAAPAYRTCRDERYCLRRRMSKATAKPGSGCSLTASSAGGGTMTSGSIPLPLIDLPLGV